MKKTIKKFELKIQDTNEVMIPIGGYVISAKLEELVHLEEQSLYVWAIVDESQALDKMVFKIYADNQPMDDSGLSHIYSFKPSAASVDFHLFFKRKN